MDKKFEKLQIINGSIIEAQHVKDGGFHLPDGQIFANLPEFYRVVINLKPTSESNINVEVWLPLYNWNGRFLGTGNGGGAGVIQYAALAEGIREGFATANTDMGTSPNPNSAVEHPEIWKDFGYRATHLMTVAAKEIIREFYGKDADYSYFRGASTGGQQALMEAQRYPEDYNGIIAGVPANNRTLLHTYFLWALKVLNEEPESLLSSQDAALLTDAMVSARSAKDGGAPEDQFFTEPEALRDKIDDILMNIPFNKKKITALKKVYSGPVNPRTGERIYTSIPIGSENSPSGLLYQQNSEHCPRDLLYLFKWAFGEGFDWRKFDFDHDLDILQEKLAPILNANNPDLSSIKRLNGKILMFSGTADPLVPYQDALNYYERVIEMQNGLESTQEFFRYYLVPGRCHGEDGSPGFNRLSRNEDGESLMTAMIQWVEQGKAPEQLMATAYKDSCTANEIIAQRPVYPYPLFAQYINGDVNLPSSYKAAARPRGNVLKPAQRYLLETNVVCE